MYQFKAKGSQIKPYPLCLGNVLKHFTIDNMAKTRLKASFTSCTSFFRWL